MINQRKARVPQSLAKRVQIPRVFAGLAKPSREVAIRLRGGVKSPATMPLLANGDSLEMLVSDSTNHWLRQLKAGNRQAAQELWERYYWRMVGIARRRLNGRIATTAVDESDIAQSAFASFYRAAEQGRFPQLNDRSELWRLLIVITRRKVSRRLRQENCRKRRPTSAESSRFDEVIDLEEIASDDPSPEFCLMAVESLGLLLNELTDKNLRAIALLKMEGHTNEEIALKLGCSLSTVERKLRRIRNEWTSAEVDRG